MVDDEDDGVHLSQEEFEQMARIYGTATNPKPIKPLLNGSYEKVITLKEGLPWREPLPILKLTIPSVVEIRPRPWLYGYWSMRGAVTLIAAPGGTGKTALMTSVILACATGKSLLDELPLRPLNVVFLGLEESTEEMHRRFAAAMIHHKINQDEFDGRIFFLDGRQYGFCAANLDDNGNVMQAPDMDALRAIMLDLRIDILCADPLALLHTAPENDNSAMAQVMQYFNRLAQECDCGVILVHHTRKGAIAGDPDGIRGAGALVNHARIAIGLSPMNQDEAKDFNVSKDEQRSLVRIDDLKRNYSPRSAEARWIRLESVRLGNETDDYPQGDYVQVPTIWLPPEPSSLSTETSNEILDDLARGIGPDRYQISKRAVNWAGKVIIDVMNRKGIPTSDNYAKTRLADWIRNKVIEERIFTDSKRRKEVLGIFVNETNRPGTIHE